MFGWFGKKPAQADIDSQAKAAYEQSVEIFKRTWAELNPKVSTPEQ
jgi:hypothetical protein